MDGPKISNAGQNLKITGSKQDDWVRIFKDNQDGKLKVETGVVTGYQNDGSPILKDLQVRELNPNEIKSLEVDFDSANATDASYGDTFLIDENVDLRNYNLLINGGDGSDLIAVRSGSNLGNTEINSKGGDDVVQFGESITAKSLATNLGKGDDFFQVFNRYQDAEYRKGNPHFINDKVNKEKAPVSGLKVDNSFSVKGEDGDDQILIGSYADAKGKMNISGGKGEDKITVMDQVGKSADEFVIDGGEGNDWNWIGERKGIKAVTVDNRKGNDGISIDQTNDIQLTDTNSIHQFDLLSAKFINGTLSPEEKRLFEFLQSNPEIQKIIKSRDRREVQESGYLHVRSAKKK